MNFDNSVFNSDSKLTKIEDIEIPVDISVFDEEAKVLATLKNLKGFVFSEAKSVGCDGNIVPTHQHQTCPMQVPKYRTPFLLATPNLQQYDP